VHAAFAVSPGQDAIGSHELEAIGTGRLLNACLRTKVRKVVLWSHTLLYGAHPTNPNFLAEHHPLRARRDEPFLANKIDAEAAVLRFGRPGTGRVATVLRTAAILGPTAENYLSRYLGHRLVTTVLGFDPLWQFVHETDAVRAFQIALDRDCPGVFNIVGEGVLPLSAVIRLAGSSALPLPRSVAEGLFNALWLSRLIDMPPSFLDYLQYLCVADGARAPRSWASAPCTPPAMRCWSTPASSDGARPACTRRTPREATPPNPRATRPPTVRRGASRRSIAASFRHAPRLQRLAMRTSGPFRWSDSPYGDEAAIGLGSAVVPPQARAQRLPVLEELDVPPLSERAPGDIAGRIRALEARPTRCSTAPKPRPPAPPGAGHLRPRRRWSPTRARPRRSTRTSPRRRPRRRSAPIDEGLDAEVTSLEAAAGLPAGASATPEAEPGPAAPRGGLFHRQRGRQPSRRRAPDVDEFGLDPEFDRRYAQPAMDFLFRRYFRARVAGIDHVPATGRCLIVANHWGTVPLDGAMLRAAIRLEHPSGRDVRWLSEDFLYYLPFAGTFITRTGAVRACAENAARLLATDRCVVAFPEGVAGIRKLYRDRYRLQRFGRGGFVRLALRAGAPIIPCAIVGAEETGPMLFRDELVARWSGSPTSPSPRPSPGWDRSDSSPRPTRWTFRFGEPLALDEYGPGAAEDDLLVARVGDHVRTTIQRMLDEEVRSRKSVWLG
jgi:1-acyl-sn-glycerol-3-phosphate acyltransferase